VEDGDKRLDINDPSLEGVAVFRPLFARSNRDVQIVPAPLARSSMVERAPYKSLTRGSIPPAPKRLLTNPDPEILSRFDPMQINDQDLITQRPDLAQAIRDSSQLLEQVIGPTAALVKADWTLIKDDQGRPLIDLRISDWTGSVGYRFSPDQLDSPSLMQIRLHRLWGDLLMVQSHVRLDHMIWELETLKGN
jgi:hypothetical protein